MTYRADLGHYSAALQQEAVIEALFCVLSKEI